MFTMIDNQLTPLLTAKFNFLHQTIVSPPVSVYHHLSDFLAPAFENPIFHFLSSNFSSAHSHPLFWFLLLFTFRYLRLIIHCISFYTYTPTPVPDNPTITPQDCTVIIPTVDPTHIEFTECLQSCLLNRPKEIIIITVGINNFAHCKKFIKTYADSCPATKLTILATQKANKRIQVARAIPKIDTKITVLLDDHVLWGRKFLITALAPFEDPQVGAVGTNKCVRKEHRGFNKLSYWNMLGALYLERHNFEIRATNHIDGGVFVISGRTSLHRSEILKDEEFQKGFVDERFFFGWFGPLNADDDNFITRWEVQKGWKIRIQYSDDACIETTLGAYPKFIQQCLRWVRTTWRSNSASLFTDRTVWRRQPWCVYAVYITSFFNFALFNDAGLAYLLWTSEGGYGAPGSLALLGVWIFLTKMVKLWPYFRRYPEDLRMLPGYFAFAYFHSLIKGYAMLTFWNCHWGGRDLDAINAGVGGYKTTDQKKPSSGDTANTSGTSVVPRAPISGNSTSSNAPNPTTKVQSPKPDNHNTRGDELKNSPTTPPSPSPQRPQPIAEEKDQTSPQNTTTTTTSSSSPPRQTKDRVRFTPPSNIEDYHLHLPAAHQPTQSSSSAPPRFPHLGPPIPAPNFTAVGSGPCAHCLQHRCLALLMILLWGVTVAVYYWIDEGRSCAGESESGKVGRPVVVSRDWARTQPDGV